MIEMDGRILIFGASSTWGAWDNEYHGWVNRLQLSIEHKETVEHEGFYKYEVLNLGVSGETSRDILNRIEAECKVRLASGEAKRWLGKEENIIIIETGKNDARIENGKVFISSDEFRENLKKILEIAKKYADNVAFIGCSGPLDEEETIEWDELPNLTISYTNESNEKYSNIIKEFCEENSALFIDIYTPLNQSKEKFLADGLHLNERGHKIVAEIVEKELIKASLLKFEI